MAKNIDLRSAGYTPLVYTPAADVTAGDYTVVEDVNCFPIADIASGVLGSMVVKAEQVAIVLAAVTVKAGEKAYYHATNKNVTNVASGAVLIGHFLRANTSGDAEALVEWDGTIEGQEA